MRLIYFHQHFSIPTGNTGSRSYAFARTLVERGHKVTMVCGSYDGAETGLTGEYSGKIRRGTTDGIDIIEISVPYSNKMSFPKRVWQFAKFALISTRVALQEDYDLLFATSTPLTVGIPAIAGKIFRRKPMVFEVRDLWPELPKAMGVITNPVILFLMSMLEWSSYHAADHVIGLSPGMVEGIKKRGIKNERVSMVPNSCDLELFNPEPCDRQELDFPAAITKDHFVAAFTGAHGIANGLEVIIKVAEELKRRKNDRIKLLLIGDGKKKQSLIEEAEAKNLDNIVFMNPVPKIRLIELLRGIDLGLMILKNVEAFYFGTSPNKFFDYLAAGKPILVNYPGWMSDLVKEHNIGYAVTPDSPVAFADALEQAAESDLAQMGVSARNLGETQFNRSEMAENFVSILEQVHTKARSHR